MTRSTDLPEVDSYRFTIEFAIPELLSPIDWIDLYQLPSAFGVGTHRSSVPSQQIMARNN